MFFILRMSLRLLAVLALAANASWSVAVAADPNAAKVAAGQAIAQEHCARCHGIGRTDESPREDAPPFQRLHERYPVEHLAEAFAEGIVVGHTDMPEFAFQEDEIESLLAYLKSLEHQPGE